MLQRFLFITLTLCSLSATAQWQQTGSKVRYVNGLGIPTKDTAAGVSADSSQIVIRPADSALYIKYKRTWLRVGGGGGSIAGGGTAGQVSFFTGSSAISGDSALFWDNTNKRLGIHTPNPGRNLDVHGTNVIAQFNGTGTNNAYLDFQRAGSTQWRIGNQYAAAVNRFSIFNAAGATENFTILQNGNIGINIIAPEFKLDVRSTATGTAASFGITGLTINPRLRIDADESNNTVTLNPNYNGSTSPALVFKTQEIERVRITSGGKVNIGGSFTSTNNTLQVTGNAAIGYTTAAPANGLIVAGDVGIGLASPEALLHINKSTAGGEGGYIYIDNPAASTLSNKSGIKFGTSSGASFASVPTGEITNIVTDAGDGASALTFGTFNGASSGERMRIAAGGNVGIGSYTSPAAKLVVDGTTLINTNTDNGLGDKLQVSGSAIATRLKVNTSGQTLNISTYYNGGNGNNLWINNTEPPLTSAAENNVGIGIDAMISNTSGSFNYALGGRALQRNTSGGLNTAIGFGALEYHTTGTRNTGIGVNALNSIVSSTDNIGIGSYALQFTTGNKNVAIGSQVMYENTTGSSNIAFGLDAGRKISGGSANQTSNQSIFIGEDTRASAAGNTNEMVFGHTAIGQGSNTVTLGNSSITKTFLRGNTMVNTTTDNGVDKLQVNGSVNATTQILNGTGTTTTLSLQAANGVGTLRWLNGAGTSTWATYSPAGSSLVFRDVVNSSDVLTLAAGGLATFGSSVEATQFKLSALNTAPSSAGDTGTLGEIRIDANYIYICTATNTWKRVAIATW